MLACCGLLLGKKNDTNWPFFFLSPNFWRENRCAVVCVACASCRNIMDDKPLDLSSISSVVNYTDSAHEKFVAEAIRFSRRFIISENLNIDHFPLILFPSLEDVVDSSSKPTSICVVEEIAKCGYSLGYGVRSLQSVDADGFLGFIFGETISKTRKQFRESINVPISMFDFKYDVSGITYHYYLDTRVFYSPLALCNHDCEPNAEYYFMIYNNKPVLAVFAISKIKSGQFIHFDYWREQEVADQDMWDFFPDGCKCGRRTCKFVKTE